MSSDGENNSSQQENIISWKSAKAAYLTTEAKYKLMLEHTIKVTSTNLPGTDPRGTLLGNDSNLVDIQPDIPPPNLQQSTLSATKLECHTKVCTYIGDMLRSEYARVDPRSKNYFCAACFDEKRKKCNAYTTKSRDKKESGNNKIQKLAHDEAVTKPSQLHPKMNFVICVI